MPTVLHTQVGIPPRELSRGRKRFNHRRAQHALFGLADVRHGATTFAGYAPYPAQYDGWAKIDQINYESGRLNATNARAAGLALPNLRAVTPANYARYRDLREAAIAANGPAIPVAREALDD